MAVNEYDVLMKYKDAAGDITLLYPITKQENVITEGDGAAYTASVTSITELKNGVSFVMIPHTVSTTVSPTLNVNGLGAKKIQRRISNNTGATSAGASNSWLAAEKPVQVIYDGSFWIADLPKPAATDLFGVTPIENGGTNATTAEEARANILPEVTSEDEGKTLCVSEDGAWVVGKTSGLTTLYVTAPANVTVVASKGDESISEVANSDGLAVFDGLSVGTWTISITNDYQTVTQTIVVEPDYTVSLSFFDARIKVTYPQGSTCTCSDGNITLTASDTSGSYTFIVPSTGTWTVSCENDIQSDSATVLITEDGQSETVTLKYFEAYIVATFPEGSTCTCSNGSTVLTASGTSTSYIFNVPNTGTWTVYITNGKQEASEDVTITADGQSKNITLKYFEAYVAVTYPEGSTCKCTDGITTLTASGTTGSYTFSVPNIGTWTISCEKDSRSVSATASITSDGQKETVTLKYFEAYIAVTYPEGSTCTCSNGSTILTAPGNTGSYTFNVPNTGTWTISCENSSRSDSTTVSITTDGENKSVTLKYFESYIAVTYPEGSTCTCTNGSTVLTAPDTSGTCTFTVPNTGTWTITCKNSSRTDTTSVTITADGQNKTATLKYFEAYIEVDYPSGSSCTCTNGSTVLTASDTSGNYTFTVPNTGNWTISCKSSTQSDSTSVNITSDDQYEVVTLKYFAAYISVTYPSGSTCKCTDGTTTLTASDTSGSYTFTIPNTGKWTVSCTNGSDTVSEAVNVLSDGEGSEVTLKYFTAYINVTYNEGATCTCSNGSTTLTASDTTGSYKFTVKTSGSWTVTCTKGSKSKSKSVTMATDGQTSTVTLINRLYLYNSGDKCTSVTGGWTTGGDATFATSQIQLSSSGTIAYTKTNNKINTSEYMTAYMVASFNMTLDGNAISGDGTYLFAGLTSAGPPLSAAASVNIWSNPLSSDDTYSLDLTSLSGSYNFGVWAGNRASYIDQIYLE